MSEISAPAKVILFGEHAVVYGQPAIAVPVSSLRATAVIEPNPEGFCVELADTGQRLTAVAIEEALEDSLITIIRLTSQVLETPLPHVTITIRSTIPMASGLGSGAAVSATLVRAMAEASGKSISLPTLNDIVFEVEKLYHGTPSGIDNTVIVYEQPVYFVRNQTLERLQIKRPFHLLIGDTGKVALTRHSVGDVRALYEKDPARITPILDAIGAIAQHARKTIEQGHSTKLGPLMDENHHHLQQLTVSSPELDMLVAAARNAGALGAKLSGGGRGGNMIALVDPDTIEKVRNALRQAGAVRVFETTVGE
ncbi:MAG: mevalonate kinase [Anaerolineae bacterium]|nr:mevalonate kinase [Anaerolineae bacterium]